MHRCGKAAVVGLGASFWEWAVPMEWMAVPAIPGMKCPDPNSQKCVSKYDVVTVCRAVTRRNNGCATLALLRSKPEMVVKSTPAVHD